MYVTKRLDMKLESSSYILTLKQIY